MMKNLFFKTFLALSLIAGVSSCQENFEAAKVESAFSNYDTKQMNREICADNTASLDISFTIDEAWSVSIEGLTDDGEWLTVDSDSATEGEAGDYTLQITPGINYTGEQRSARVDIISSTSGKLAFVVKQTATSEDGTYPRNPVLDFQYEGDLEVTGYADQVELGAFAFVAPASWSASTTAEWVIMDTESGEQGAATIKFSANNVNATGDDKVASITISVDEDSDSDAKPIVVALTHKATTESGSAPVFEFEVDSAQEANQTQDIKANQTQFVDFTFTAPAAWEATTDASWLDITSDASGKKGEATLTFAANAYNTTGLERTATITLSVSDKSIGTTPLEISLTQSDRDESGQILVFAFKDSTGALITEDITNTIDANQLVFASVEFNAPAAWTSDFSATWLTMSQTSGDSAGTYSVKFVANNLNTTGADRVAKITLAAESGEDNDQIQLVITQKYNVGNSTDAYILNLESVSETTFSDIAFDSTTPISVEFNASYSWTVTSKPSWLTLSTESGDANSNIVFTATPSANTTSSLREGTIVITTDATDADDVAKTLKYRFTQAGDPNIPTGITISDFNAGGRYESENPEGDVWEISDASYELAEFESLAKAIERSASPITLVMPNLLRVEGHAKSTVYTANLTKLKAIYLPEATYLGIAAFSGCTGLELIYAPKVDTLNKNLVASATDLKTLVFATDSTIASCNANTFSKIVDGVTLYTSAANESHFVDKGLASIITSGYTGQLPW